MSNSPIDHVHRVSFAPTFDGWRDAARTQLAAQTPPEAIDWHPEGESSQMTLLGATSTTTPTTPATATVRRSSAPAPSVPKAFVSLARRVARHRDGDRWTLLYRALWRLTHGEPALLKVVVDDDVFRLHGMAKAVHRDMHKMKAFVRFRKVENDAAETWFIAWHRPDHRIVEAVAPFFAERFNDQRWMILTPDASVSWDLKALQFGPGVPREAAPASDELEDLWRTYYASIFNPARVKVKAMKAEMPVRHWATLPEASLIPELLRDAPTRVRAMVQAPPRPPARDAFPAIVSLATLAEALPRCQACVLCENGTRPVAGEGPENASTVFVGEQPGDVEEQRGRPFVGPAGAVLDRALERAGLDRAEVYLTNTVKHFKHEQRGVRRIHKTPGLTEVSSCLPWVREELALIRPPNLVCLGATAARALIGGGVRLRRDRGRPIETPYAPWTLITYHPSALLRIPDPGARRTAEEAFAADLHLVAERHRKQADGRVGGGR